MNWGNFPTKLITKKEINKLNWRNSPKDDNKNKINKMGKFPHTVDIQKEICRLGKFPHKDYNQIVISRLGNFFHRDDNQNKFIGLKKIPMYKSERNMSSNKYCKKRKE